MSANMTFDVETSTHRPKYRLWLGLYIITKHFLKPKPACVALQRHFLKPKPAV